MDRCKACVQFLVELIFALFISHITAFAFPSNAVIDNFNRANENPIAAPWSNGFTGAGDCAIVSNEVRYGVSSTDASCWYNTTYGANQEVYATYPNATNHNNSTTSKILACLQDLGTAGVDGYAVSFTKRTSAIDEITIEKLDNGTYSALGATENYELTDNDKIGLEVKSDGTLNFWVDTGSGWTFGFSRNDGSPFDCSNTNIGLAPRASGTNLFDDFGGGNLIVDAFQILEWK